MKKKNQRPFYFFLTFALDVVAAIVFFNYLSVNDFSTVPLFFFILTLFQAWFFGSEKVENGFRTNYPSETSDGLNAKQENERNAYCSRFLYATLPWFVPFILFFPTFVKCLSVLVYLFGFVGGALLFKNTAYSVDESDGNDDDSDNA